MRHGENDIETEGDEVEPRAEIARTRRAVRCDDIDDGKFGDARHPDGADRPALRRGAGMRLEGSAGLGRTR